MQLLHKYVLIKLLFYNYCWNIGTFILDIMQGVKTGPEISISGPKSFWVF